MMKTTDRISPDLDGIPAMLVTALHVCELTKTQTGRTTRMVEGLAITNSNLIVCSDVSDFNHIQRLLKNRGIKNTKLVIADGLENAGFSLQGLQFEHIYFSHLFCHDFFLRKVKRAEEELNGFANYFRGKSTNEMKATRSAD